LCTALTELLPVPDPKLQTAVIDSLRKLGYKTAIPAIRDVAQMSLDPEVIRSTADCLAAWGDTASAPILRQVLTGCTDGGTWRGLAVSLHKLEGAAASRFLVDQFPALTEQIQWEVLRWDDSWDALKAANTRALGDVLQRLEKRALSDEMRKLATLRLARLLAS
jgi:HEAT repeat protein